SSPYDRCTVESIAPGSANAACDGPVAWCHAAVGSSPSRSPSSSVPTSPIVLPAISGSTQRCSPTTWFTRACTSHSVHGVALPQPSAGTWCSLSSNVSLAASNSPSSEPSSVIGVLLSWSGVVVCGAARVGQTNDSSLNASWNVSLPNRSSSGWIW